MTPGALLPSNLRLGWRTDAAGHPLFWLKPSARAGKHRPGDLVTVPAAAVAAHTAIIAQSGSGKSYFLGRLIEEILLQTRARVAILDPNGDFRVFHSLQPPDYWRKAGYDRKLSRGILPTEVDDREIRPAWEAINVRVLRADVSQSRGNEDPMRLWWPYLSMDLLSSDISAIESSEMRHCHRFVQAVMEILAENSPGGMPSEGAVHFLEKANQCLKAILAASDESAASADRLRKRISTLLAVPRLSPEMKVLLDEAILIAGHVSPEIANYYFGSARECQLSGLLRSAPPPSYEQQRALVLDLPSLPNAHLRMLSAYQVVTMASRMQQNAWQAAMGQPPDADRRTPLFIVVDEAHNLIPAEPANRAAAAMRDSFRTIVAEGRKFGLFLIIVSQRPDKLDAMVLSGCENRVLMKLDSMDVVDKLKDVLGLGPSAASVIGPCVKFALGRGLVLGPWTGGRPTRFMTAARRTLEGGRNLKASWWAAKADAQKSNREERTNSF